MKTSLRFSTFIFKLSVVFHLHFLGGGRPGRPRLRLIPLSPPACPDLTQPMLCQTPKSMRDVRLGPQPPPHPCFLQGPRGHMRLFPRAVASVLDLWLLTDQPFRQGNHCSGMFQASGSSPSQPGPVAMSQPFTGEKRGDWPASHFFQLGPCPGLGVGRPLFFPLEFAAYEESREVLGSMGAGILGGRRQVKLHQLSPGMPLSVSAWST